MKYMGFSSSVLGLCWNSSREITIERLRHGRLDQTSKLSDRLQAMFIMVWGYPTIVKGYVGYPHITMNMACNRGLRRSININEAKSSEDIKNGTTSLDIKTDSLHFHFFEREKLFTFAVFMSIHKASICNHLSMTTRPDVLTPSNAKLSKAPKAKLNGPIEFRRGSGLCRPLQTRGRTWGFT